MSIVIFDDVKEVLDLREATLEDYPKLKGIFDSMQPAFERYCSRLFDIEERTKVVIADDYNNLKFHLDAFPITDVAEVLIDGDPVTNFNTGRNFILFDSVIDDFSKVSIRYTGGIVDNTDQSTIDATLPDDLNMAAIRQIAFEFQNIEQIAVKSRTIGDATTTIPETNLLKYTKDLLAPYVNYGLKM